ncbi:T9SS type A sorting domain-containing protein [Flavobacterium orientale]|uniref:Secretion system C-terminal sorting domain-containing protein n=1 Tax=Flavobacterium orientale TaxID=1756020 RepID=A0A916XV39_9FLAO|nr:T9SS type A sorting domain-containing protein [Flavobacterium orientale]GGD13788.1 hypothetical protein GCM10011343_01050 [Flavobacterium orientale]
MKKTTLMSVSKSKLTLIFLLLLSGLSFGQTDFYFALPGNGSTSQNGRAPQGAQRYNRSVWLISAAEMSASGLTTGTSFNSITFSYTVPQNIATSGNMIVYLENTSDIANNKSTNWATAIGGMTVVSNGAVTIPASETFTITFAGGSPFTYSGSGLYVAFDYSNPAGTLSTPNTGLCTTTLTGGLKSAMSTTAAPTTIAASNWRPQTVLGIAVSCARPVTLNFSPTSTTSATLSWTTIAPDSTIEWGPIGFTQGSGTTLSNVTSPYLLGGLAASSNYSYYVRSNCAVSNSSIWAGPIDFHTVYEPVTPPYTAGFEVNSLPFVGWSASGTGGNDWFINPGAALAQEGNNAAAVVTGTTVANNWMFSRGVNLVADQQATITYYVRNFVNGSTNIASYQLRVGTSPNSVDQTTTLLSEANINNVTYALKTVNYTPTVTGTYYFGFLHNSPANAVGTHAFLMDNFNIQQTLSVNDLVSSSMKIYPNPSKDFVTIESDNNYMIDAIQITDLNGRIIDSYSVNANEYGLNISNLSKGVYLIRIATDNGVGVKKLVKE